MKVQGKERMSKYRKYDWKKLYGSKNEECGI